MKGIIELLLCVRGGEADAGSVLFDKLTSVNLQIHRERTGDSDQVTVTRWLTPENFSPVALTSSGSRCSPARTCNCHLSKRSPDEEARVSGADRGAQGRGPVGSQRTACTLVLADLARRGRLRAAGAVRPARAIVTCGQREEAGARVRAGCKREVRSQRTACTLVLADLARRGRLRAAGAVRPARAIVTCGQREEAGARVRAGCKREVRSQRTACTLVLADLARRCRTRASNERSEESVAIFWRRHLLNAVSGTLVASETNLWRNRGPYCTTGLVEFGLGRRRHLPLNLPDVRTRPSGG